jgi:GNAT superfamily N-acetyltransferase
VLTNAETSLERGIAWLTAFALADGGEVLVREAVMDDAEGLRRMFERCSQKTVYQRFHTPWTRVPSWAVALLVGTAERDGGTLVASEGGEIVGHAMFVIGAENNREAEVAVVVEDGRRSVGLGGLLLREIAEEAREAGVEVLTCATLGDNYRLLELVRRTFPNVLTSYSGGACSIRVPLAGDEPVQGVPGRSVGKKPSPGEPRRTPR